VVSEIRNDDSTLRPPINVWEEGGFRLEVVNTSFQEMTGLKPFDL
jgi:hypothetical protein